MEIVDQNGLVVAEVVARLWMEADLIRSADGEYIPGLRSWGGQLTLPTSNLGKLGSHQREVILRDLESRREGRATLSIQGVSADGHLVVDVGGTGPAPFEG